MTPPDAAARRRALWQGELDDLRAQDRLRALPGRPAGIDFVSNDYLGLRHHPALRRAAHTAITRDGCGAGAARLLGGAAEASLALEHRVAAWLGTPAALLFPSGYQANLGVITALADREDVILSDALIHASSIDACRQTRATVRVFAHADLEALDAALTAGRDARRRLVLTEGVFGMDGDVPRLREMHALCAAHDAWLIVDEAHSAGLLGPRGRGAWAAHGGRDDRALAARVVTFGKALGSAGAAVAGDAELCALLAQRARSFVFSTAPAPAVIAAAGAAIELVQQSSAERDRALQLARRLAHGLDLQPPDAAIVPLPVGDDARAVQLATTLQQRGFDVRAVRPPTVPPGTARLRLVCHATNTEAQVDALVEVITAPAARTERSRRAGGGGRGDEREPGSVRSCQVFVAGTDTGIGKTVVAAALVRSLGGGSGGAVRYYKPVQTGEDDDTGTVRALTGDAAATAAPPLHELPLPASPHEAARDAGVQIDLGSVRDSLHRLQAAGPAGADWVVELAGGLMVPYGDGSLQIDWLAEAAAGGARVVLVARSGLGTLNHSLLSLQALRARGVTPTALVLVGAPHDSNRATLAALAAPVPVVELPVLEPLTAETLAQWAATHDWPALLRATEPVAEEDWAVRGHRCLWHPYTQHGTDDTPLPVVEASGSWLTLADGRRILDGISSWWTSLHGHGRAEILDAVRTQGARLDHVLFAGATHRPAVELAERLLALAPPGLARVFYSDDGSTAVEVALKIVRQAWVQRGEPQRRVLVALDGGYHGDTLGAMAVGDPEPFFAAYRPWLFEVERVPAEAEAIAGALQRLGERAAGVIAEPLVQGAAGMRMHGPELLQTIRAVCDRHDVPWIADEVMTGFGRTGAVFACSHAGVRPDLMCVAKGLTGGVLPLAATLVAEPWFEAFLAPDKGRMFFHGHSFTANPLGCAAALASLDLIEREATPLRLDGLGQRIETELRRRLPNPAALGLRRCGGIVALDVQRDGGYLDDIAGTLRAAAVERGCLLRPLGPVVYAMPPASTTEAEADRIADVMASLAEGAG